MIDAKAMLGPVVAILLVTAVVCPIIAGMGITNATLDNETSIYAAKDPSTVALTIAFNDTTGGATVTYDGATFEIARTAGLTLAANESWGFRFAAAQSSKIALYSGSTLVSGIETITFENGSYTYTKASAEPVTASVSGNVWHVAKTGDYGLYNSFNANADSEVFLFMAMSHGASGSTVNMNFIASGTAKSLTVSSAYTMGTNGTEITSTTTAAPVYTETTGGVISVTGVTVTANGYTDSYSTTQWYFAPVEYSQTGYNEDGGIVGTLVNIVPVLLIVGVVLSIVVTIMRKRE